MFFQKSNGVFMRKKLYSILPLAVFLVMLLGAGNLKAQVPAAPFNFEVGMQYAQGIAALSLHYSCENINNVDSFKVYLAYGTGDTIVFTPIRSYTPGMDSVTNNRRHYWFSMQLGIGCYSMKLSAINEFGEGPASNVSTFCIENLPPSVAIITQPIFTAVRGQLYTYDVNAVASNGGEIVYSLVTAPDDMTINPTTGVITWTPGLDSPNAVTVVVRARIDGTEIFVNQSFTINVQYCSIPPIIIGHVRYENQQLVPNGIVGAVRISDNDTMYRIVEYHNGYYTITLDEGCYKLKTSSNLTYLEWWENSENYANADSICLACGDTLEINFVVTAIENSQIVFTSQPVISGVVGMPYTYDANAVKLINNTIDSGAIMRYSLFHSPQTMTINEETGLINWTPLEPGTYTVKIKAWQQGNPNKSTYQEFVITVRNCANAPQIIGFIRNEDGEPMQYGTVFAFRRQDIENNNFDNPIVTEVNSGENFRGFFSFFLDEGDYYLFFNGNMFYEEWWENSANISNATYISLECGEITDTLNVVVEERLLPQTYTVAGQVRRQSDSSLVPAGIIEFRAFTPSGAAGPVYRFGFQGGMYSVNLSNQYQYIVRAIPGLNGATSNLLPLFWNQKIDPTEADMLILTSNVDGINFYLPQRPVYNNAIHGDVVANNNLEESLPSFVVAYLVATDGDNEDYIYYAFAGESSTDSVNAGRYTISNIIPGEYVIFAFAFNQQFIPGYYRANQVAALNWQNATRITVGENDTIFEKIIRLPRFDPPSGIRRIRGRVVRNGGITMKVTDSPLSSDTPVQGANVYLTNSIGTVVGFATSDTEGNYEINNIPDGAYTIQFDRIGLIPAETEVVLNAENSDINVNIELNYNTTGIDEQDDSHSVLIFPNPASNSITIDLNDVGERVNISIFNLQGEEMLFKSIDNSGSTSVTLDTRNLNSGSYIIKVSSAGKNTQSLIQIIK